MFQKDNRKKIVFLGTPLVATIVLDTLVKRVSSQAKVVVVVTQPPSRSSRQRALLPSPVQEAAYRYGIGVLTPVSAKDEDFLADLEALEPDLCVTAAYGQFLPARFLSIPRRGTVNIHPSLLPLYRGASPVQRSVQAGDTVTGVSLLYSVLRMDAGPIIAQERYAVSEEATSEDLLTDLFRLGSQLLVKNLPQILSGTAPTWEQDHAQATLAKKLGTDESLLHVSKPARVLHNQVRAFTPWPGTRLIFEGEQGPLECKIIQSRVAQNDQGLAFGTCAFDKGVLSIVCADNSLLQILALQPQGKRVMSPQEFANGLRGHPLRLHASCF